MEWRPGVIENLGYYVYLLIDPGTDRIFYVGKGVGSRCLSHVWEARRTTRDTKGDYEKLATIRAIEESGHEVRIEILRHGLTESEAFHLEAASMDLLGFSDLSNRVVGAGPSSRRGLSVSPRPSTIPVSQPPLGSDVSVRLLGISESRRFMRVVQLQEAGAYADRKK